MRVKIQRGSASIEVEGEFDEVEKVLEGWWPSDASADSATEDTPPEEERAPQRKTRTRRSKPTERAATEHGINSQEIVNSIRDDPRFETFKAKVILDNASRGQRAKFVSWFTHDQLLTSGDIQRVLQGLGVKMDPATASRAMTDVKDDYIKDASTQPARFRLTTRAHADFEAWLLNGA